MEWFSTLRLDHSRSWKKSPGILRSGGPSLTWGDYRQWWRSCVTPTRISSVWLPKPSPMWPSSGEPDALSGSMEASKNWYVQYLNVDSVWGKKSDRKRDREKRERKNKRETKREGKSCHDLKQSFIKTGFKSWIFALQFTKVVSFFVSRWVFWIAP